MPLNLIPEEKINKIHRQEMRGLAQNYGWLFLGLLVVLDILVYASTSKITHDMAGVIDITEPPLTIKIKQLNSRLSHISAVLRQRIDWSDILSQIGAVTPASIKLTALEADKPTGLMKISGQAITRDDLLNYKVRLESLLLIKKIDLPVENLFEKYNVSFVMTAVINLNGQPNPAAPAAAKKNETSQQ